MDQIRTGDTLHLNPRLIDCILPPIGRDHPTDITGSAVARQIPPLYHDSSDSFDYCHRLRTERAFPFAGNTPNGIYLNQKLTLLIIDLIFFYYCRVLG